MNNVKHFLVVLMAVLLVSCASVPAGWEQENAMYVNTKTGLVFPKNTENLLFLSVRPWDEKSKSESIRYSTPNVMFFVVADLRDKGDISADDYFKQSKSLLVKSQSLKKQIKSEAVNVVLSNKIYPAKIFRGYSDVTETEKGEKITRLWSCMVIELDNTLLKLSSSGVYFPESPTTVSGIKTLEDQVLGVVFDEIR